MAIKGDRQVDSVEVGYYLNSATSQGVIVSISTAGSGIALDDPNSLLTVPASSSGAKPVGMLLTEVVSLDLTRTPINWHRDQINIGGKVTVMTKGWAVTDQLTGTPTAGQRAVLSSSGAITGIAYGSTTYNEAANPDLGRFRSTKNENGFAKVYIDL
jgi:hypothetical protein